MVREKLEEYFYIGIFLIAMIFALVSIIQLYMSISDLISIWLNYKYQPVFKVLFSVSVLAICIYLIRERLIKR